MSYLCTICLNNGNLLATSLGTASNYPALGYYAFQCPCGRSRNKSYPTWTPDKAKWFKLEPLSLDPSYQTYLRQPETAPKPLADKAPVSRPYATQTAPKTFSQAAVRAMEEREDKWLSVEAPF